jgi:hypothetical protein
VSGSRWGKTPRESVEEEAQRRGRAQLVSGCRDLIAGRPVDPELILALGGPPARWVVTGEPAGPPYWPRVWALRGLLWVWEDVAIPSVMVGLDDDSWRVRERALKVVARHRLHDALDSVGRLRNDQSARVRAAAGRAEVRLLRAQP